MAALARSLRLVWGNPGTRLGMWSHFVSQFWLTVFTLLWGYPFLVRGEGLSTTTAGTILMAMTGWVILSGLVLASMVTRFPFYRSFMVLGIVATMAVAWAAVLLWPGPAPLWLLVVMAFATASGGPASMVGFDLARSSPRSRRSGRANGVVNIGGFLASLLTMALVGVVLDLREPPAPRRTTSATSRSRSRCSTSSGPSARSRCCATGAAPWRTCAGCTPARWRA